MSQYILTYPIDGKIYYSSTPKNAAKKAFIFLAKNNYNQSRIILKDNNTKKEYNYIGMTNTKLNEYDEIFKSRNPIQLGGGNELSDKDFYNKLSKLSGNINVSIDELSKILKAKYEPKENNEIVLLVKEGINKLDQINNNVTNMNEEIYNIRNKLIPEIKTNDDSDDSISTPQNITITDLQTNAKESQKSSTTNIAEVKLDGSKDDKEIKSLPYDKTGKVQPIDTNLSGKDQPLENEGGFCTIM